jgi:hypothetical protein
MNVFIFSKNMNVNTFLFWGLNVNEFIFLMNVPNTEYKLNIMYNLCYVSKFYHKDTKWTYNLVRSMLI